jgi:hypothetical protein
MTGSENWPDCGGKDPVPVEDWNPIFQPVAREVYARGSDIYYLKGTSPSIHLWWPKTSFSSLCSENPPHP